MIGPPVVTVEQAALSCQVAAALFRAAVAGAAEMSGPGFEDMDGHQVVVDLDAFSTELFKVRPDGERLLMRQHVMGGS